MASEGIVNKHVKGGWFIAKYNASGFIKRNHATATIGANSAGESVTRMNIVMDFSDSRLIDNGDAEATSNVVITKVGSGPCTLILKLHKTTSISGGSAY